MKEKLNPERIHVTITEVYILKRGGEVVQEVEQQPGGVTHHVQEHNGYQGDGVLDGDGFGVLPYPHLYYGGYS